MFTERTRALLESDRSQFLATKMWLGMGFSDMYGGHDGVVSGNGVSNTSSMIEHEVMCGYSVPAMNEFMVQHQLIPPHHQQPSAKSLLGMENGAHHHHHHHHQDRNNQQQRYNTTSSMRGRRSADVTKKQNYQNGGSGGRNRAAKEGTYVSIIHILYSSTSTKSLCRNIIFNSDPMICLLYTSPSPRDS